MHNVVLYLTNVVTPVPSYFVSLIQLIQYNDGELFFECKENDRLLSLPLSLLVNFTTANRCNPFVSPSSREVAHFDLTLSSLSHRLCDIAKLLLVTYKVLFFITYYSEREYLRHFLRLLATLEYTGHVLRNQKGTLDKMLDIVQEVNVHLGTFFYSRSCIYGPSFAVLRRH